MRARIAIGLIAVGLVVLSAGSAVALPTPTPTPTAILRCTGPTPSNPCIPGGGSKNTDCNVEWVITSVPTPLQGIPKNRLVCYEGDRRCDFDPDLTNSSCTFQTTFCINNTDSRLTGCVPSELATFEMTQPGPDNGDAADAANRTVLETQAGNAPGGLGLTVMRKKTPVMSGAPNATANRCSTPCLITVPLKQRPNRPTTTGRRTLGVQATTSSGARDMDSLRLECRPSTCGNGVVEADHEECDDGNRDDGDGCDRGCQLERFGVIAAGQSIAQPQVVNVVKNDLGAAWVRLNLRLDGNSGTYQNFRLFLDAGVNVVLTFNYQNRTNILTTYGSAGEWPAAGFPFVSRAQYQQDVRDALNPVLDLLGSGRLWLQCENEVNDASVNPSATYWRGTTDQYLTQLAALHDVLQSMNRAAPVVMTSFAFGTLDAVINSNNPLHDDAVAFLSTLLRNGKYEAVDLHFYGCVEDIPAKAQWVSATMPAGKRWISTENGGPDFVTCANTPYSWKNDQQLFEDVEALQVPARLGACANSGGTACLWFSLFDLQNSPDVFSHLGLLDQSQTPPRHKPAFDAFFAVTHP